MITYKVKGISDHQTECDCCGRKGLKRTIGLEIFENGESTYDIIWVGRDCASILTFRTGKGKSARKIEAEAQSLVDQETAHRECEEKKFQWKIKNRISSDNYIVNSSYLSQWKDNTQETDMGTFLRNGELGARIPSQNVLNSLPETSAEIRFVNYLKENGFNPVSNRVS